MSLLWVLCFCFDFCVSVVGFVFLFSLLCFCCGLSVSVLAFVLVLWALCFCFHFCVCVVCFVFLFWLLCLLWDLRFCFVLYIGHRSIKFSKNNLEIVWCFKIHEKADQSLAAD